MRLRAVRFALVLAGTAALLGCGDDPVAPKPPQEPPQGFVEPDFSLLDLNTHSATYTQACSPRQHLGHISAWYFGHAT